MKLRTFLSVLVLLMGFPLHFASAQETVQKKYSEAVALFNSDKFGEALILFEEVLVKKPDFVYARSYAARCKSAIAKGVGPKNDLEGKLKRLIVPDINFSEAPLGDVLDYLSTRASEVSGGTVNVNFIYKGTPEQRANTLITISLRNAPLSEVIKYVGQLSKSRIQYEEHAVVVDPNSTAPAPAVTTPIGSESSTNTVLGEPVKKVFD